MPCAEAILGWWLRHLWCARALAPADARYPVPRKAGKGVRDDQPAR